MVATKQQRCRMCGTLFDKVGRQEFCGKNCRGLFWFHKQTKGPDPSRWRIRRPREAFELTLSPTEAAYAAGFFDGEGHLGITKQNNRPSIAYAPRMSAVNTSSDVMAYLAGIFGGNGQASVRYPKLGNSKPIYCYRLSRKQLQIVLPQLLPYLVIKRRMASAVLRLAELLHGRRTTERDAESETLYQECRRLNRRGRS